MTQKITLKINGQSSEVEQGVTVLQAARQLGITIPTLCDHPDLHPYGGCRLCVVEVKGARFPMAACQLPVSPGMEVTTESRSLRRQRKAILTMILSTYYESGYHGTQKTSEFMYWVRRYGISPKKYMAQSPRFTVDARSKPVLVG